jgi:hypothetical protein
MALVEDGRADDARHLLERARSYVDAPTRAALTLLTALPSGAQRGLVGSARRIRAAFAKVRDR